MSAAPVSGGGIGTAGGTAADSGTPEAEHKLHADESDRLFRLARIAARAAQELGRKQQAAGWLRKPVRALNGQAPMALLDTEAGAHQVEEILGRIEYGLYS